MTDKPASIPLPDLRQIQALAWLTEPMHRRWIVWRWMWNNGKWDKPPFQLDGSHAAADNPDTWTDYDTAHAAVEAGHFDGIGLMLHGLPSEYLAAIDLDDVRDPRTGELLPWASALVNECRSYCEVTPSGRGIRILGTAPGIETMHRNGPHPDGGRFELFINCKRYITVSGQQIRTNDLADDTAQITALHAMLGRTATPPNGSTQPDNEQLHRGAEFFRAIRTLKAAGHSAAQVLAAFEAATEKYRTRLGTELARAWDKLGDYTPPPDDRWPDDQPPPPRPDRILPGARFKARHVPPLWLIKGIVQRSRLYACTSLTAHGKTAVWLFNACMVQAGRMIGNLKSTKGNVLYLAGENPADLEARMLGMTHAYSLPDDAMPYVLPGSFPLTEEEADILKRDINALGIPISLIVGDTASSFFPGDNENDNVQAGAYARTLRSLTLLPGNPAIVALCHPVKNAGKSNLLPRGGGAFLNELDGNLTLWSDSLGEVTELHWQGKIRGPDFSPFGYALHPTPTGLTNDDGEPETTVFAEPMSDEAVADHAKQTLANEDVVLRALRDHPDWSWAQTARDAGWLTDDDRPEKWRVQRALRTLASAKLVQQPRPGAGWELTDKGRQAIHT